MAKTYEDIGKDASEFITKGFPNAGTFKAIAEIKTPNGVTVKSTGTRSFDFKDNTVEEKVSAEVEPKIKCDDVEVSGKISTAGEYEGGVTYENLFTKGAKASVTAAQSEKDGNSIKGSASFKNDDFSVKAGIKYPFKQPTHANWTGEVTYRHEKMFGGVALAYDQAMRGKETPEKTNLWTSSIIALKEDTLPATNTSSLLLKTHKTRTRRLLQFHQFYLFSLSTICTSSLLPSNLASEPQLRRKISRDLKSTPPLNTRSIRTLLSRESSLS
jgi:hypothetical protein